MALLGLKDNLLDTRCDEATFCSRTEHVLNQVQEADATGVTSCLLMVRMDANVLAKCTRK